MDGCCCRCFHVTRVSLCECKFPNKIENRNNRWEKKKYHKIIDYVIKFQVFWYARIHTHVSTLRSLYHITRIVQHICTNVLSTSAMTVSWMLFYLKKLINFFVSFFFISNKKIKFITHKKRRTKFTCTNDSTDVYQFVSSYINVLSSSLASAAFSFHFIFSLSILFCLLAYGVTVLLSLLSFFVVVVFLCFIFPCLV